MRYVQPSWATRAFTCPHCGVLARQVKWGYQSSNRSAVLSEEQIIHAAFKIAECEHCKEHCVWVGEVFAFPNRGKAPPPNPDMPTDVLADYDEAAKVYTNSPRGAAALLRLAVQKLMKHVGQPGKNINSDIKALVERGLPPQIQQSLDIVRVTGNNAVHPGQIDADDPSVAEQLFPLVNVIVESQISVPARIAEMYARLPEGARQAISERDSGG